MIEETTQNSKYMVQNVTQPTAKYTTYLAEVETALRGKLSKRERKRLTGELALLRQANFISVNGITHHYLDVGPRDGEAIVLVHGWDCSAYWWHSVLEPLAAAGYRVICYDLKGHGFSDSDPARNYTVAGFHDDLYALVKALHLGPHHLAAFSLGAFVALYYTARHDERVLSQTLFNFSEITYNKAISAVIPRMLDVVFNNILRPIERRNLWWIPFIYARAVMAQHTPPVADIRFGTLALRCCDPEAVRVSARELASQRNLDAVPAMMAQINAPTLLVAGANDPIMQPKGARRLISRARNGTYFEVPKCGHLILFELPEQVVSIMKLFLRAAK
jgi:pimeloyl-ACP methyl ester carboxylesterase